MNKIFFSIVLGVAIISIQGCGLQEAHEQATNPCYDYPDHECPTGNGTGDAPIAEEGSAIVYTDESIDTTLNAIDNEGDPISFRVVKKPDLGTLTGSGADRVYYAGEQEGVDTFTFIATDGSSDSEETVYTVTIRKPKSSSSSSSSATTSTGTYNPNYSPSECAANGYFYCTISNSCQNSPATGSTCD